MRTKILGLMWRGSRQEVVALLKRCIEQERYGSMAACPLCQAAGEDCSHCCLPGYGDKRCTLLHKIMQRSSLKKVTNFIPRKDGEVDYHKTCEIKYCLRGLLTAIIAEGEVQSET